MTKKLAQFALVHRQHVRMLVALVVIALLVLGIGAPADGGGGTGRALFAF